MKPIIYRDKLNLDPNITSTIDEILAEMPGNYDNCVVAGLVGIV